MFHALTIALAFGAVGVMGQSVRLLGAVFA